MKFSEAWLREWVNPDIGRDDLLEQLTMAGLEVDGVEPVAGEFTGVVVARVTACERHPNADQLSVCTVDDGTAVVQIVCGAPNVRAGLTVAFARIGARLPGDFKIKKATLRGVESQGMLCGADELAVGEKDGGILELSDSLILGSDLREVLQLNDIIVDLDLTPNRGDCLSVRGLAREVGVLNDCKVLEPAIHAINATIDDSVPVLLDEPAGCPRYLGRVIRSVDLGRPTPQWMQEKLRRSGLRSIDPVVDVTNYVLLELGQPLHAFDLAKLRGPVRVRFPKPDETLTLLDGKTITLDAQTLLIADETGPLAMAGVMGGANSGVAQSTQDIFLECAFFSPLAIAGTARRYGLHTDASHRYERGVDYQLQTAAMDRACELLQAIVGGDMGPVVESVDAEFLPRFPQVAVREQRLNSLMGVQVGVAEVDRVLAKLGLSIDERSSTPDGVRWLITPPSHRFDIAVEADLVEEICRIYGYDRIPVSSPSVPISLGSVPRARRTSRRVKQQLAALGYQEAITYSFVDPELQQHLDPGQSTLALQNPMSVEQSVMRTTLLPGLVQLVKDNLARQHGRQGVRLRAFEFGRCFIPGNPVVQVQRLGGILYGGRESEAWNQAGDTVDYFDLKGDVESLLESVNGTLSFTRITDPILHPGQSAGVIVNGQSAGRLGRLHPGVERALDCPPDLFVFELDADIAMSCRLPVYNAVSRFPSVRRDLALLVDRDVSAATIEQVVHDVCGAELVEFRLFDVYEGKGIDSNKKSVAIGLTLQRPSATLTDAEINQIVEQAVASLAQETGAVLR